MTKTAMDLDTLFATLSSTARRDIVTHLAAGPATTTEIGRRFPFSKQALSRHLVTLEQTGLIRRSLRGRVHQLELIATPLEDVNDWADTIRSTWSTNLDRLGGVLEDQADHA